MTGVMAAMHVGSGEWLSRHAPGLALAESRAIDSRAMRIPRCYTPQSLAADHDLLLDERLGHYLTRVLRMRQGDALLLFNGEGQEHAARIAEIRGVQLRVRVLEARPVAPPSALALTLAQAICRGEKMDQVLQKATELGVRHIVPIHSERTEVRLDGERAERRAEHWRQVLISACEQSGRADLPTLAPVVDLATYVDRERHSAARRYVLDPRAGHRLSDESAPAAAIVLVGPEGGLSESEIDYARHTGFTALSFGPRVLRTETAGPALLAALQSRWGDCG